jgi:hypothetical protein
VTSLLLIPRAAATSGSVYPWISLKTNTSRHAGGSKKARSKVNWNDGLSLDEGEKPLLMSSGLTFRLGTIPLFFSVQFHRASQFDFVSQA